MKKITFLFLLLISYSFFGQTKYHRLKELGESYTLASNNFCANVNIGGLKLNIQNIAAKLPVGETILISVGDSFDGYYLVEYSQDQSYQDADEFVSFSDITIVNFNCVTDTDGDGVADSQDNCPNQAGPSSNNGCPVSSYDLEFDTSRTEVYVQNRGYVKLDNITSNDYFEIGNGNGMYFRNITIKNTGGSISPNTAINLYLSIDNQLNRNTDPKLTQNAISLYNIQPGASRTVSNIQDILAADIPSNVPLNNYYLFLSIDQVYNDVNFSNNTISINNVQYTTYKSPSLKKSLVQGEKFTDTVKFKVETIHIYDFSGNLIEEKKLHSESDRKTLIENLPRGMYILKHEDGFSEKIAK